MRNATFRIDRQLIHTLQKYTFLAMAPVSWLATACIHGHIADCDTVLCKEATCECFSLKKCFQDKACIA